MNGILELIHQLDPLWIYLFVVLVTFGENLFPPFPGDIILVFCGYLSGAGQVNWLMLFIVAYAGSIIGFMVLHELGRLLDRGIIQTQRWRWLPYGSIDKVERWFSRHGPFIIVINRFLMGVRSAIAIVSGMAKINRRVAFICASISIAVWTALLVLSGKWLGENWQEVQQILVEYRRVLTVIVIIGILVLLARYFWGLAHKSTIQKP